MLPRLAHATTHHRKAIILAWLALTIFGGFSASQVSQRWLQSLSIPGYSAYEANQRSLDRFGTGDRPPNVVVFKTKGDATKSEAIRASMERALEASPGARASSFFSTGSSAYVSKDRHTTFMELYPAGAADISAKSGAEAILAAAKMRLPKGVSVHVTGRVAIDYALLMIFRFRDELREGRDVETALVETMTHAGKAVIVSGTTVAVGLLSLIVLPMPFIRSVGIGGMLIPAVSVLAAITLLPALPAVPGA